VINLEYRSSHREAQKIPLPDKVELLRESVEAVQKYELLTTNQYLQQMDLLLEILQDISRTTKGSETT